MIFDSLILINQPFFKEKHIVGHGSFAETIVQMQKDLVSLDSLQPLLKGWRVVFIASTSRLKDNVNWDSNLIVSSRMSSTAGV